MQDKDLILGLFYSDETKRVFEKIKFFNALSDETDIIFSVLSLKYLGVLFLAESMIKGKNWTLNSVESTLTAPTKKITNQDIIQSFFCLNSSKDFEGIRTNLFTFIGSPYTEDVKLIHQKLIRYIHPSIIQGNIVNRSKNKDGYNFHKFIDNELERGINLIEYSLGSSRKMHWEEKQNYYCIGIIERKGSEDLKRTNLYTFDYDDLLKNKYISSIPSYYVMAILPDYYENRIIETLRIFNRINVYPNIRWIDLSNNKKKVLYLEEFLVENNVRKSYGVILINTDENHINSDNITFYKKKLRLILDKNKNFEETVIEINPKINPFEKWNINSQDSLKKIHNLLDNEN